MNLRVEIMRNADGVIAKKVWRDHEDTQDWDYPFWWIDGNAGCDCNRELWFFSFQGYGYKFGEVECGDGRFSVRLHDDDTGKLLFQDGRFESESKA